MSAKIGFGAHPRVITIFNEAAELPGGAVYENTLRLGLRRLFADPFFFEEPAEAVLSVFQKSLPLLRWSRSCNLVSLLFLARHRLNTAKFFYEMIQQWLVPGQRIDVAFHFAADFKMPDLGPELYTFSEMVVRLADGFDESQVEHNLHVIEAEIRLGMVSFYHASRILEVHSLDLDEKNRRVQEKISSLIQKRPDEIDYDIFGEMQYFLLMSSKEFRVPRGGRHLSRLIAFFYVLRKSIVREMDLSPEKRHVRLKLGWVTLDYPWGTKRALAVYVGLNFLKPSELFEERHLTKALLNAAPHVKVVPDSFFMNMGGGDNVQTLYLEIEKSDGSPLLPEEIRHIRHFLPGELKRAVEVSQRPLFMPRNEEEVMRSIVTLAKEIRFRRDLPQVVIQFEAQTETELCFTIVLVRVLTDDAVSIQKKFEAAASCLKFVPDRVRRVGLLRKKYPKEATVFRVKVASESYVRDDHSVDLFKARLEVVAALERVIGPFRDYNGGMISKQLELLASLKAELSICERADEVLLETFFQSLFPVEMRAILNPHPLKILFSLWKTLLGTPFEESALRETPEAIFFMTRGEALSEEFFDENWVVVKPQVAEESFFGGIYFGLDPELRCQVLSLLDAKGVRL